MRAINLLPKDAERARRTTPDPALLIGVAGFAIVVAAIFSMFISSSQKVQDNRSERDRIAADLRALDQINPPPKVLSVQQTMAPRQAERIDAVASALSFRMPWDYILGQVAMTLPSGVKLVSLIATAPISPDPEIATAVSTGAANKLELKGWTYEQESVSLLMTRLRVLPALEKDSVTLVNVSKSGSSEDREFYEFAIFAKIKTPGATS